MNAIVNLLGKLQSCGVKLKLDDTQNLVIRGNKHRLDKTLIEEIKALKPALVEYFLQNVHMVIEAIENRDDLNLTASFAQRRLWLLDQIDGGSAHYNMPCSLKLSGKLNVKALNQAFTTILERHESLRTCFAVDEQGQPVQVIQAAEEFAVPEVDLSQLHGQPQELQLTQYVREEAERVFDLQGDLMLRAQLIKLADNEFVLLLTMHHIASDGWSMSILINEFRALYRACVQGEQNPLAPLAIQYADYAHWQRNWLQGEVLEQQLNYWTEQLADLPTVHNLPLDHARPELQTFAGKSYHSHIDAGTNAVLNKLCQAQDATLFMGLQAAFSVLLARYSNETDIVVGSPIANREQAEVASLIGFFANTLIMRSDLSANPSFAELLLQSKAMLSDAYVHQQVPFEQVVDRLQPERSLNHSALFQVMLILQNNKAGVLELPELELSSLEPNDDRAAKYDLTLDVTESKQGLHLSWEYNTDLFERTTITRMAEHFDILLKSLVAVPEQSVFSADMLSTEERSQLLSTNRSSDENSHQDLCVHELFEAQAEKSPNATALIFDDQQLSYGELNKKANQLAHYLLEQGLLEQGLLGHGLVEGKTDQALIGICIERSPDMVIAILAVLKAGGAYVALDPEYPEARLQYMLDDAELTTVLTVSHLRDKIPVSDAQALCIDDAATLHKGSQRESHKGSQAQATQNPDKQSLGLSSSDLAYVVYTSGSTGQPKGVLAEHRSICNRINWMEQAFPSVESDVFCQKTAAGFVDHVAEIFQALSCGKPLVIVRTDDTLSADRFTAITAQHKITRLTLVPSLLKLLIEQGTLAAMTSLRLVVSSGEALQAQEVNGFYQALPNARLLNFYGSSEVGADVSFYACDPELNSRADAAKPLQIPIGQAIANTQLYVLGSNASLLPQGVSGELYVGGAGLARGYLKSDALTAEKFIANPYYDADNNVDGISSERLYKTGDLVRWLPKEQGGLGYLEYLGRMDHQVKINGSRIELGEVENALTLHPQIKDAVVIAKEGASGDTKLFAYVVPKTLDASDADNNADNDVDTEADVSFSLFYFGAEAYEGENKYDLYLKAAKFADENDFEAIWTPERHFDLVGGLYPNPSILNAALATITQQIKLRAGSVVLPLHDPIRVAEEWAVVDNLSNGRVGIAVASGWHTRDFVLAPDNYESRRSVMSKEIDTLKTLWAGGSIVRKDGVGDDVEVQTYPKPIQKQLPLWITASISPKTFIEAGRIGANVLTHLLGQTIDELAEKIVLYRESLEKNGFDPQKGRVTLMIHTYLGDDLDATMEKARGPFKQYMRSHISLIIPVLKSLGVSTDDMKDADLENMADFAFERYAQSASFIGTPQSVTHVAAHLKDIGVNEYACLIDWLDNETVLQGLDSINELKRITHALPPSSRVLNEHCRALLPQYMVPAVFTPMDALPLSSSGKVDRKALPEPDMSTQQASYVAPRTDTEKALCQIWQEVLDVERVGIMDNFFHLGGNSLSATRLIANITQSFGVTLALKTLFHCKDLSEISRVIVERITLEKNQRTIEENRLKEVIEW
ncbi:MAG: hypothetical protein COA42_14895 [Alteromonadaceae bacterium]|nr:MAG: hypothetical protein COA42_14895 [Alteromonadaceae bacterium]